MANDAGRCDRMFAVVEPAGMTPRAHASRRRWGKRADAKAEGGIEGRLARGTVLVVEDDADTAEVLGEVLTHAGHDVIFARDGVEAIQVVNRHAEVSVVLLDL